MKNGALFLLLSLTFSACGLFGEKVLFCEPLSGVVEGMVIGKVVNDDCGWYIQTVGHDPIINMRACNFPESHFVPGLKIKFTYQRLNRELKSKTKGCNFLIPVTLEDWWVIK